MGMMLGFGECLAEGVLTKIESLCVCTFPYGLHGSAAADPLQNQDFLSLRWPLSALWVHIGFDLCALIGRS